MTGPRILYIAYPLLTVSEDSAGGAEQMLWTLEHEMAARGVTTAVAASRGSQVAGELFSTGAPCEKPDALETRRRVHHHKALRFVRQREKQGRAFDIIHDKSGAFWPHAPEVGVPVLATLHLPRHFYPAQQFTDLPRNLSFNCVSNSQAHGFADLAPAVIPNGILLDKFKPNYGHRRGLLWLGRICEEKGAHIALDVAASAGLPITIAGQVYPFSYHQQYFAREIEPRLQRMSNAILAPSPAAILKRTLLREAQALLITSQVEETSSLVAMEAAASGTPVIAFRRGALPEVVLDGVTGFLVDSFEQMPAALKRISEISPAACVQHARRHFPSSRMADAYAQLYVRLAGKASIALSA